MKRTVKVKNLIAFAAVLILLFSITAITAYAEFPPLTTAGRRMGSWILSALTAANIALTSTVSTSQGADLINFLADPLDVHYSYTEAWEDRPTIQIWDDYVTIDGVSYTDIWLSNEAASKFKTNGMDFVTAYDIASNTNGTFASGAGTLDGLPLYDLGASHNPRYMTQSYNIPTFGTYQIGSGIYDMTQGSSERYANLIMRHPYGALDDVYMYQGKIPANGYFIRLGRTNNGAYLNPYKSTNNTNFSTQSNVNIPQNLFVSNPFDFDWVAGTIDATPLAPEDGMMIRVPKNSVPDLDDFLTDNPEFGQPGGTTIDVNVDPDIMNKLDDLINIIAPIIPVLTNNDINFTINHTEPQPQPHPEPAPDVDPDTPVTDITYNDYYQTITNQTEYINNTVENIDNSIQNVNENIENVNNNIENIVDNQDQIIENQDTIIENQDTIINDSIPEIIDNIPKINEICNNIDTAPYHDLDTGLDHLPAVFLPFITDLRSALGIWHYVTEWIGQISTTFAFVSGCLAGTTIMTPIYASIAGFMCIKVYRRMTG